MPRKIITPDQTIPVLDILAQVRQNGLVKERALLGQFAFAQIFQRLQRKREARHFHGLRVDVHAEEIVLQDVALEFGGQADLSAFVHVEVFAMFVAQTGSLRYARKIILVPFDQLVIRAQQEGTASAGRIKNLDLGNFRWREVLHS